MPGRISEQNIVEISGKNPWEILEGITEGISVEINIFEWMSEAIPNGMNWRYS